MGIAMVRSRLSTTAGRIWTIALLVVALLSIGSPGFCAESGTPRIKEIRFDRVVRTAPADRPPATQYETTMRVQFEPLDPPLSMEVKIHYKNRSGEGNHTEPAKDVSQFSKSGTIALHRVFQFPGTYTLTIILRNQAGESSMTAPPLGVP